MKLLLSMLVIVLCITGIVTPFTLSLSSVWFEYIVAIGCFSVLLVAIYAIVTIVE